MLDDVVKEIEEAKKSGSFLGSPHLVPKYNSGEKEGIKEAIRDIRDALTEEELSSTLGDQQEAVTRLTSLLESCKYYGDLYDDENIGYNKGVDLVKGEIPSFVEKLKL